MSDMTPPPAPAPAPPTPGGASSSNARLIAMLGWIFAPLGIIAIFMDDFKNDHFVRSNTIQAAGVWLAIQVVGWVLSFVLIGFLVFIAGYIYLIVMAIQAYNGKEPQVPVIYGMVKNFIDQTS
jgi:uncharacterized membrane protein